MSGPAGPASGSAPGLGILAGGTGMPLAVAASATAKGWRVHMIGVRGEAIPEIERYSHTWVSLGEIGKVLAALKQHDCSELVIIGSVTRPDFRSLRFDLGAVRNLPLLLKVMVGGDDHVLGGLVKFFEAKGLVVRGAHEVAPELVATLGSLGRVSPTADAASDIAHGSKVVKALGALDIGQAAVVVRGHVLAVEAAEGTDAMLARTRDLRRWGEKSGQKRLGVLVKLPKPGQELRVDMPTIGPRTVEGAAAAGLAGIAIAAGHVLIAERSAVIAAADAHGLFVAGIDAAG
jgi:hypothetical protein